MIRLLKFLTQRLFKVLITMFVVLTFVFFGARLTGDPFSVMYGEGLTEAEHAKLMKEEGLDQPVLVQYKTYLQNALHGDFGRSITSAHTPVVEIIMDSAKNSFSLRIWSFLVSIIFGIAVGLVIALRPQSRLAKFLTASTLVGYAVPGFVIAVFMIYIFSFKLKLLPSLGNASPKNLILPVIALSAHSIASTSRYVKTHFVGVMTQDYIRTAWAKGIGERPVVLKHGLKNILVPLITVIGVQAVHIITGSLFIEKVFAWPGMGERMVRAVTYKDFPVIQFGVVYISVLVVLINFAVDILYGVIDPRIREDR